MPKSFEFKVSSYWVYPIIFAFLFIVFSPVIFTQYAFSDDYFFLATALQGKFSDAVKAIFLCGRPLQALCYLQGVGALRGMEDLSYIRALGVAGIFVTAAIVYRSLSLTALPRSVAISGALLSGLIPPYQVYAAWASCFYNTWACALAALAFTVCNEISDLKSGWIRLCGSILLLSMSLATYQPAAMVFWDIAAIAWLLRPNIPSMRSMMTACAVMFSSMALHYVLLKFLPIALWGTTDNVSRTALVQNYAEKIIWFLREPLVASLNVFSINPSIKVALIVVVLIFSGFFLFFERNLRQTLIRLGIAGLLVPATYTPNLLVAENWASYRTQVGLAGLILICVIIAIVGWMRFLQAHRLVPALCLIAIVGAALAAERNVITEFAVPQAIEYHLVKNAVLREEFKQTDKIYFKCARWSIFSPIARYDEFGLASSAAAWGPPAMLWLILKEHHSSSADLFALDSPSLLKTPSPGCKIIDMDAIVAPH